MPLSLRSLALVQINMWVMFDDAHVATVGDWQAVLRKCAAGRIQPLVLFYKQASQSAR